MVQEYLKSPRGHLSFLQNKMFKIARFKCVKNSLQRLVFPNCPSYIKLDTLGVRSQNNFGNSAVYVQELKTWQGPSFHRNCVERHFQ